MKHLEIAITLKVSMSYIEKGEIKNQQRIKSLCKYIGICFHAQTHLHGTNYYYVIAKNALKTLKEQTQHISPFKKIPRKKVFI